MNHYDDYSQPKPNNPTTLPRVPSTSDFSKLLHKSQFHVDNSESRRSRSCAVTDGSENSQILYMTAPTRSKRLNRSLSSLTNGSGRELDGSSDCKSDLEDKIAEVQVAWGVIDREIFEWLYICRTGRPYWWSPESKYSRLRRLRPRLSSEASPRLWMPQLDDGPKLTYDLPRRAVSDSYIADPDTTQDLAHLVAVQLLGACFTLPPEHVTGIPSPNYAKFNKNGPTQFQDPRMISSLQMHTNFRYSPSFGHEPRNTSPVQLWHGTTYDGPSPSSSPLYNGTGLQPPVIATSEPSSKRRRVHRTPDVSESSTGSPWGSQADDSLTSRGTYDLEPTAAGPAGYRRRGVHNDKAGKVIVKQLPSHGKRSSRRSTDKYPGYRRSTKPVFFTKEDQTETSETYRGGHKSQPSKTNYRMQPVIRSEPHPVYVQPVRELVVKRWKTFRRRFGGSLHSPLPDEESEELISRTSESGQSGSSSPAMSSDGRARRFRARERGEIHSSTDSTMHYNSPASGHLTPNDVPAKIPYWIDSRNPSPRFELIDPLAAAVALAAVEGRAPSPSSQESASKPLHPSPPSETSFNARAQSRGISELHPEAIPKSGSLMPSKLNSIALTPSFTPRRTQKQRRRQSMLSEVCTPQDFDDGVAADAECHLEPVDKSILSVVGSALATPREDPELPWTAQTRPEPHENATSPGPTGMRHVEEPTSHRRPRLARISTSGTQIFTPGEDGVELDGMPVGPSKEMWSGKGKRRERTYL